MKNKYWSQEEIDFLKKNYYLFGVQKCADILGRTYRAVNDKKQLLKLTKKRTKLNLEEFFNPSPRTAYIYGILWADGSLYRPEFSTRLTLIKSDADALHNIFYDFGIRDYQYKNKKPITIFSNQSKEFYNHLSNMNYENKSGGSAKFILNWLPEELHRYWWLGFFNGDGCIYKYPNKHQFKLTISSTYDQDWSFTKEFSENLKIVYQIKQRIHKQSKSSIYQICSQESIKSFGNYIYQDYNDSFGFKRKKDKFDLLLTKL